MRGTKAALVLLFINALTVRFSESHPICLDDSDPTHRHDGEEKFKMCEQFERYGCCDKEKEMQIYERFLNMTSSDMPTECIIMLENMLCQECSPFAGHIYLTKLYSTDKSLLFPGLCRNYCQTFYDKCNSFLPIFVTNSSEEFCDELRAEDDYYCYPFVESNGEKDEQKGTPGCLNMCLKEVANKLYQPLAAMWPNDGTNRFFVLEQRGYIWTYLHNLSKISHPPFLDITDRIVVNERKYDVRGLLNFAFHPSYKDNGLIFVYYCHRKRGKLFTRVSQFKVSENDMNVVDKDTEKIIIEIQQDNPKHNGGGMLFGADGYLYLALGDGGVLKEYFNRGQDMRTLLGKILRLDVDSVESNVTNYSLPNDNPYVFNPEVRSEIFASGLRNPWRCSIDRGEPLSGKNYGRIFCGDVGSSKYEEINLIKSGANFGWRVLEGNYCSPKSQPGECTEENIANFTPPAMAFSHKVMDCIIGGNVYRGCQNPILQGLFIASALKRGGLVAMRENNNEEWEEQQVCMQSKEICEENGMTYILPHNILSFAEDIDGELYILSTSTPGPGFQGGRIFQLFHTPDNGSVQDGVCSPSKPNKATLVAPNARVEDYKPLPTVEVRLMNDSIELHEEGRLEIRFEDGNWGTVCGRSFSRYAAEIACVQSSAKGRKAKVERNATIYGKAAGNIWLSNVHCQGQEGSILDCYHDGWGNVGNCTHNEDVALKCLRKYDD